MIQELDPPVILNTNLFTNPSFEAATGGVPNGVSAGSATVAQSTDWAASGSYSARITPTGATNDTRLSLGGDTGGFRLGMQAGKTYTILGTCRLVTPQLGSLHSRARTITAFYRDATGVYIETRSAPAPNLAGETDLRVTLTIPVDATEAFVRLYNGATAGNGDVWWDDAAVIEGVYTGDYFDGSTQPSAGVVYTWSGATDGSVSYQMTPASYLPVQDVSTLQVLYGSRVTSYRYELLAHNADGTDSLSGYLDGVLPTGTLDWQWTAQVKGSGALNVLDLDTAQPGMTRIRDVTLTTMRVRPVLVVEGLPDIPLGVYLVTAGPEVWSSEGRQYNLELHDRTTVLDQDQIAETFTADATTPVMTQIANLIATAGEQFTPDNSETRTLAAAAVWPVGTSKLTIVNDLLQALNYFALTVSGSGDLVATPSVLPADRTITYQLLNGVTRELVDGETSIYQPDWNRDRDVYGVPNKVVAVATGSGTDAPAQGSYSNTDPASPFSYAAKGRWIVSTVSGVQVPSDTDPVTFLNGVARDTLIAMSSPQATVTVKHLPLPLNVGDVIRFASTPAGIDARHVVVGLHLDLNALGLMQSNLQEVIDL